MRKSTVAIGLIFTLVAWLPAAGAEEVFCDFEDNTVGAPPTCQGMTISSADLLAVITNDGNGPRIFGAANCDSANLGSLYADFCQGGSSGPFFHGNNCLENGDGLRVNSSTYGITYGGILSGTAQGFTYVPEDRSPQPITFTFDEPVTAFEITMFDYGDYMPAGAAANRPVEVEVVAFDGATEIDDAVLSYTIDGNGGTNPRGWSGGDDLWVEGDACTSQAGDPGYYTFRVEAAPGETITSAVLTVVSQVGHDPKSAFDSIRYETGCATELIAGNGGGDGEVVGTVTASPDADYNQWTVSFDTTGSWFLTELHLHAACDPDDLPQTKKGNPKVGHFAYHGYPAPGTQTFVFPDDAPEIDAIFALDENGEACIGGEDTCTYEMSCCTCPVFAAHAVVVNPAVCEDVPIVIGAEQYSGDLYSVDLVTGAATQIADIDGSLFGNQNYPNGVGRDAISGRIYFTSQTGGLYFWNGTEVITAGSLGTTVAGGTFFNGNFYYVLNGTDDLYRVAFANDGTMTSNTLLCPAFAGDTRINFGDVVVDPTGPTILGSGDIKDGTDAAFFTIDLDGSCNFTATQQAEKLQLAFGSDGVLYGHATGSGYFFTLDPANGDPTFLGDVPTGLDDMTFKFTDLADGCIAQEETAWGNGYPFPGKSWATYFDCGPCTE